MRRFTYQVMTVSHPPEIKAAVMAALLTGQRVGSVAEAYNVPQQTVSHWSKQVKALVFDAVKDDKVIDIAAGLNQYLEKSLAALVVQVEHSADRAWLKQQDASAFAVLHGVMVDKIVRLLEAAEAGRAAAEAERERALDATV